MQPSRSANQSGRQSSIYRYTQFSQLATARKARSDASHGVGKGRSAVVVDRNPGGQLDSIIPDLIHPWASAPTTHFFLRQRTYRNVFHIRLIPTRPKSRQHGVHNIVVPSTTASHFVFLHVLNNSSHTPLLYIMNPIPKRPREYRVRNMQCLSTKYVLDL